MLIKDLQQKSIMIWGKGAEGSAALSYLQKHKVCKNISIYNDDDGSEVLESILSHTDVIIRSPGVSIYKKELQQLPHIKWSLKFYVKQRKIHYIVGLKFKNDHAIVTKVQK